MVIFSDRRYGKIGFGWSVGFFGCFVLGCDSRGDGVGGVVMIVR